MSNELKCPFCKTELEQMHDKKMLGCPKCLHIADGAFWAKAIQAKQDLEIATKALKQIVCADKDGKPLKGVVSCWLDMDELNKCIEQIEHKE